MTFFFPFLRFGLLQEDIYLGAEKWKKASVELSDALIHITKPLQEILMVLISEFDDNTSFGC